jgi:hypothetical protein
LDKILFEQKISNELTQEFIQGIENVIWTIGFCNTVQYPNVDLGYRINFSEQASNKFTTQTPTVKLLFLKWFEYQLGLCI